MKSAMGECLAEYRKHVSSAKNIKPNGMVSENEEEPSFSFDWEACLTKRIRRKRKSTSGVTTLNKKKKTECVAQRTRKKISDSANCRSKKNIGSDGDENEPADQVGGQYKVPKLLLRKGKDKTKPVFVRKRRFRDNSFLPEVHFSIKTEKNLPWTLAELALHMNSNKAALEFCQSRSLLPVSKQCPVCKEEMIFSEKLSSDKGLGYVFRCSRRACQIVRSARSGTWFEKSKLPIRKSLLLTYCFATNFPFSLAVHESSFTAGCTSPTTVSDWYSYCREVCVDAVTRQMSQKMGGENFSIEMKETKIGERHFGKNKTSAGQRVLGFYCRETKEAALVCIPGRKRDITALVPIIEEHINPGTTVIVDCWKAEDRLEPGYQHLVDNYRLKFKTPENGFRSNGIEKIWRLVKSSLPQSDSGRRSEQLVEYLCEFLWRRMIELKKRDPFEAFLQDAAILYSVNKSDDDL